jgi:hypothetical protein
MKKQLLGSILALTLIIPICWGQSPNWNQFHYDGNIGEVRVTDWMTVCEFHVGESNSIRDVFPWEAPQGWVILDYKMRVRSRGGDANFGVAVTAKNSNFASYEKLNEVFNEVGDYAGSKGKTDAKLRIDETQKAFREWSRAFRSANNHLEVKYSGHSHKVKVGPIRVDTKTAFLKLDIRIRYARMLTEGEAALVKRKLEQTIAAGGNIDSVVVKPPSPPAPHQKQTKKRRHA